MLITPQTSDIEDIIRNLLSWVPNNFKLDVVRNAINDDIMEEITDKIKEEVYDEISENFQENEVGYYYIHRDDVDDRAREIAEEEWGDKEKQYESEIEFWKTKYYDIEGKLHNYLNTKTDGN